MLVMAFAFQKFVPEFAGYRSIHANAARLQIASDGKTLPLVYLDWQCDGYPFYLSRDSIHQFTEDDLDQLAEYVREHSECLFVANAEGAELLQEELGESATFTRTPGARGRLYVVSCTAGPHPVVGTRPTSLRAPISGLGDRSALPPHAIVTLWLHSPKYPPGEVFRKFLA